MGLQVFDETQPINRADEWDSGNSPGSHNFTAGSVQTWRVDSIICVNNDVIDHTLGLLMQVNGNPAQLGTLTIPAGAGYTTGPATDVYAYFFGTRVIQLVLQPGDSFQFSIAEAVTGSNEVDLVIFGGLV